MKSEKAICVTKESVNALIGIIDHTISILKAKGSKQILSEEEYDIIANARSEKEIFTKVKNMMESGNHTTLCLMMSSIKRKGIVRFVSEE